MLLAVPLVKVITCVSELKVKLSPDLVTPDWLRLFPFCVVPKAQSDSVAAITILSFTFKSLTLFTKVAVVPEVVGLSGVTGVSGFVGLSTSGVVPPPILSSGLIDVPSLQIASANSG